MYLQKVISFKLWEKTYFLLASSQNQWYGSVDQDPDPYQNVMDPQHLRTGGWTLNFPLHKYPSSMAETLPRIATRNVRAEDIYNPGLASPSLLVQSTEFHFPKG
jgi:hypothetical protein